MIYLAPPDYHRVHSPIAGTVRALQYKAGTLWPVFAAATRKVDDLFGKNERLVFELDTAAGPVAAVMVGAFGVGRIANVIDDYRTNADAQPPHRDISPPHPITKGGEIGRFELGSTVVLLFGPDQIDWTMEAGEVLRVGQPIARMKST